MKWSFIHTILHIFLFLLVLILWWHVQRLAPWCHFGAKKTSLPVKYSDNFYVLPYAFDALKPVIDARTVEIHYTKHHRGYYEKAVVLCNKNQLSVDNLEDYIKNPDTIPQAIRKDLINQGGGHLNHVFYWDGIAPLSQKSQPSQELLEAIKSTFGSLDGLKDLLVEKATKYMGSGWVWLVMDKDKKLMIITTANQDSPLSLGYTPLLVVDIWEHAYYLGYQNRRPDHVKAWWSLVNWRKVSERFVSAH